MKKNFSNDTFKPIGRDYYIKGEKYIIYKEGSKKSLHIYVKLKGKVVYSSKVNRASVSIWLKNQKK